MAAKAERRQLDRWRQCPVADRLPMGNIPGMAEASEHPGARPRPLPPPPARLVEAGAPVEGTWAGPLRDAGFDGLAGEYARGFLPATCQAASSRSSTAARGGC